MMTANVFGINPEQVVGPEEEVKEELEKEIVLEYERKKEKIGPDITHLQKMIMLSVIDNLLRKTICIIWIP